MIKDGPRIVRVQGPRGNGALCHLGKRLIFGNSGQSQPSGSRVMPFRMPSANVFAIVPDVRASVCLLAEG